MNERSFICSPNGSSTGGPASTKPKAPLSAYNLFFQLERKRILEGTDMLGLAITTEDIQQIRVAHKRKGKRIHRKSHGKISFRDLARTVANRWKSLGEEARQLLDQQAIAEKREYAMLSHEWALASSPYSELTSENPRVRSHAATIRKENVSSGIARQQDFLRQQMYAIQNNASSRASQVLSRDLSRTQTKQNETYFQRLYSCNYKNNDDQQQSPSRQNSLFSRFVKENKNSHAQSHETGDKINVTYYSSTSMLLIVPRSLKSSADDAVMPQKKEQPKSISAFGVHNVPPSSSSHCINSTTLLSEDEDLLLAYYLNLREMDGSKDEFELLSGIMDLENMDKLFDDDEDNDEQQE